LKSRQACWGCRGLLKKPQVENWLAELKRRGHTTSEINKVLEVFGIKDSLSAVIPAQACLPDRQAGIFDNPNEDIS
jgi:hypothetical protein